MNPEKRSMLPKMAFTSFVSRYREPKAEEGFQDITKVDFEVGSPTSQRLHNTRPATDDTQFRGTEEQRKEWSKYWLS